MRWTHTYSRLAILLLAACGGSDRLGEDGGGDGGEDAGQIDGLSTSIWAMDWADYDGDGDLDVGLAVRHGYDAIYRRDADGYTEVWRGTAYPPINFTWGDEAARWLDVDGDGDLDFIMGTPFGVRIVRNVGGAFEEEEQSRRGESSAVFDVVDYDNDGVLDFASSDRNSEQLLVWHLGEEGRTDMLVSDWIVGIHWMDGDGDGALDILLLGPRPVLVLNRDNAFERAPTIGFPWELPRLGNGTWAVADRDGDGRAEGLGPDGVLLTVGFDNLVPAPLLGEEHAELAQDIRGWADYDGDGDLDILATKNSGPSAATYVFRNDGDEHVLAAELRLTEQIGDADWIDVDGDGDLDVATSPNNGSKVRIYENAEGELVLHDEINVEHLYNPSI